MILVLGEILFDLFPAYRRIGGAPFNFAFHLKQLGFEVAFVSRVGNDALGEEILSFIEEKGFDPDDIQVDPGHATGTVEISMDKDRNPDGDHRFFIVPDRAYDHLEWTGRLDSLCRTGPALVYFGTLIQRTANGAAVVDRVLSSVDDTALRFCDINLRPGCWTTAIVDASVSRADILKLNTDELDILVPETALDPVSRASTRISPAGPGLIILTRGEQGAVWVTDSGALDCPVDPGTAIEVADTVGAGDAYAAMAAAGRLTGLPDEKTMAMAQEFAGQICGVQGALPDDTTLYQAYKKGCPMTSDKLYIQMFSIHGLLRGHNLELGYDADTGGQIKYVVELCRTLAGHPAVGQVDLFTRLISDKAYSPDYSRPVEAVCDGFRIVRIQCGGRKYIRKELLWPHLDEFVDKSVKFIQTEEKVPDIVHGHYPDAGYVAMELGQFFGVPFVYTGHSLGRSKKARLAEEGMAEKEMNRRLKIDHRIDMEETILKYADLVITSTTQEIEGQYGLYRNRTLSSYRVIPPGLDIDRFYPYTHEAAGEEKEEALFARSSLKQELNRFFQYPDKPMILALSRPDKRKNIQGLVRAFGEDNELQAMANLAIFAGIRKDISQMEENEQEVLTRMLLLMDKYNLYGKMAIPKKHDFEHEVPALYRIVAEKKGVFVNPALTEPFGLTLLESLACGLPIVATRDGGPKDIIANCQGGILVDPTDSRAIAGAIRKIIADSDLWSTYSKNGIMNTRKHYTWKSHVQTYGETVQTLHRENEASALAARVPRHSIGRRLTALKRMLITDIDNTLLGGDPKEVEALVSLLKKHKRDIGFGVATGRSLDLTLSVLAEHGIPTPDIIISDVGACIHYGKALHYDKGWEAHISKNWKPDLMALRLKEIGFITPQTEDRQAAFKLSYHMTPGRDRLPKIHHILTKNRFLYTLIYSHDRYLDILPYRASKGKAIRYLSYKWQIPLKDFMVCGDSGNDEEMLKGDPKAVVVGNYSPELAHLKEKGRPGKKIYFAKAPYAGGILEGLSHYRFIDGR